MRAFTIGANPYEHLVGPHAGWYSMGESYGAAHSARSAERRKRETDAVIAAVKVMNRLRTKTSIMDELVAGVFTAPSAASPILPLAEDLKEISRLVQATNDDMLRHKNKMPPVRMVRWGIFVDEWMRFKDELALIVNLQAPDSQKQQIMGIQAHRLASYRKRSLSWANETSAFIKGLGARAGRASGASDEGIESQSRSIIKTPEEFVTWGKIAFVGGLALFVYLVTRTYRTYQEQAYESGATQG